MDRARVALLIAVCGCGDELVFHCEQDAQCTRDDVAGVCEPTGYCSFEDVACSGRRYVDSAGELARACISIVSTGITDAELDSLSPTLRQGGSDNLSIHGGSTERRAVIRFDLSELPADSEIVRADLHLHVDNPGPLLELAPLLESWRELEVTWSDREANVPWSDPGGGPRVRGPSLGSFMAAPTGPIVVELDATAVQSWLADPGTNHGVVVTTLVEAGTTIASAQHANGPKLHITRR